MILIGAAAHAADPLLELNDDILDGRWTLSQVDDLVVANPSIQSNNNVQMQALPFFTDNNFISSQQGKFIIGGATSLSGTDPYPLPQQTRMARLFDTGSDYMITVGRKADFSLAVYKGDVTMFTFNNVTNVNKLQVAVGDVTGNGYDDLVVMNDHNIWVLTAQDVENPQAGLEVVSQTSLCANAPCTDFQPASQPIIADFTGEGVPTLAWVGGNQGGGTLPAGN